MLKEIAQSISGRLKEMLVRGKDDFETLRKSGWGFAIGRVIGVAGAIVVLTVVGKTSGDAEPTPPANPGRKVEGGDKESLPPLDMSPSKSEHAQETVSPGRRKSRESAGMPRAERRPRATKDDPVFINGASIEELCRLPGIGKKRALSIQMLQKKLGRIHRVEDLLRVQGIGRATIRKIRLVARLDDRFVMPRPP